MTPDMTIAVGIILGMAGVGFIFWIFDVIGFTLSSRWKVNVDRQIEYMRRLREMAKLDHAEIGYEFTEPVYEQMYEQVELIDDATGHESSYLEFPVFRDDGMFSIKSKEGITIPAGKSKIVGTGVRLYFPEGYRLKIMSQPGLAAKHGISVINAPGYFSDDYSGEIKVILHNHDRNQFVVKPGYDIALFSVERNPINAKFYKLHDQD